MSSVLNLFLSRAADNSRDSSLVNLPSATDFFLCPPAIWEYGDVSGDPQTLTLADNTVRIGVYEIIDDANCMLFPIHKACLDLLQRLCQIRQPQSSITSSQQPKTLVAFCDALQQRRWMNLFKPDKPSCQDCYYARSGGIEWPHGYYGARQFWADEWNTEPGWEVRTIQRPANIISADCLFASTCAPTLRQIEYPICTPTFSPSSPSHPPHFRYQHSLPIKFQIVLAGYSPRRPRQ